MIHKTQPTIKVCLNGVDVQIRWSFRGKEREALNENDQKIKKALNEWKDTVKSCPHNPKKDEKHKLISFACWKMRR